RHPRAGDDLLDAAVHESGDPAGQRSRDAPQQRADPGQALLRQVRSRLIGQALHIDPGDDLAGELVVRAFWIAGSLISGSTLATYRLVSETWFADHAATTESGARTQPATISSTATGVRE